MSILEQVKKEIGERWDFYAKLYRENPTESFAVKMNTYREILQVIGDIEVANREPANIFETLNI